MYGCAASFLVRVWIMAEAVPHDCTSSGARPALVTHEYLLDSRITFQVLPCPVFFHGFLVPPWIFGPGPKILFMEDWSPEPKFHGKLVLGTKIPWKIGPGTKIWILNFECLVLGPNIEFWSMFSHGTKHWILVPGPKFLTKHSYCCGSVTFYTMMPEVKTPSLLERSRARLGADISAIVT